MPKTPKKPVTVRSAPAAPAVPPVAAAVDLAPAFPARLSDIDRALYAESHYRAESAAGRVRDAMRELQDAQKANAEAAQKYIAVQKNLVGTYGLTTEDRIVVDSGEILRAAPPVPPAPAPTP